MAGKYEPLKSHLEELARRGATTADFSFSDIEALIGPLPASARQYRPWWANDSHTQSLAWRAAGWHVDTVSLDRERVRFARGTRGGTYADRARQPTHRLAANTPAPKSERVTNSATAASVLLIGCVKTKANTARPARELYTSPLFARRRAFAEAVGVPWFILSSQWGLVAPEQVLAPYDMYLGDQPQSYRRAWGQFVTEQLALQLPLFRGTRVEVHAGQVYVEAIRGPLSERGVRLLNPVRAGSQGEMLQWYDRHAPVSGSEPDGVKTLFAHALPILTDPSNARSKTELAAIATSLQTPGLYSWWVDEAGAADLARGLRHPVPAGLIYAGQAGATREPSGKTSAATLASRLLGQHFNGSMRGSTFRWTIGAILGAAQNRRATEAEISQWMTDHLRVVPWLGADAGLLLSIERSVLSVIDPPLNLDEVPVNPLRTELTRLRKIFGRDKLP
jgi:hypothetical protein